MLESQVIRPSFSPWSSPVVLLRKKDGGWRFCVDYRRLNSITKKDVYPLPRVDDALDRLGGSKYFSTLDLMSGYWQCPVADADIEKTAFVTPDGLYEFSRMPFGLCNAPSTFQRLMDGVLGPMKWTMALVYLDDIIVYSGDFDEHLKRLKLVLDALRRAGLTLQPSKCVFAAEEVRYLGHVVGPDGMKPDPLKMVAVRDFPAPQTVREVRGFLGLTSYYRRYVKDYAARSHPLTILLRKDQPWAWTERQRNSFEDLKSCLLSSPILGHYVESDPVALYTDASGLGLGAVVVQAEKDGKERVISYASRKLNDAESKYHSTELEALAVVWALERFRPFIYGRYFEIVTDNRALKFLQQQSHVRNKFARWYRRLQEYSFGIRHRSGKSHLNADALSRAPVEEANSCPHSEEILTCTMKALTSEEVAIAQQSFDRYRVVMESLRSEAPRALDGKYLLVVPPSLRRKVLEMAHDESGHQGIEKTYHRIAERYWWKNRRKQANRYVQGCHVCQLRKVPTRRPEGCLQPIPPPHTPFHTIGIDHLGPFRKSKKGNVFLIVAVCYLTKWMEIRAVPSGELDHIVNFLTNDLIFRNGCPRVIISDRGTPFNSEKIIELLDKFGIRHCLTSSYHPQSNGLVEKCNGTFTNIIAKYVSEDHEDWGEYTGLSIFSINTSKQATTRKSPFELVYGRMALLPTETRVIHPEELRERQSVDDTMGRLVQERNEARNAILRSQELQKKRHDACHSAVTKYEKGELVLLRNHARQRGKTSKLLPKFKGPYQIARMIGPVTYQLEVPSYMKKRSHSRSVVAHVSNIKKYHGRHHDEREDLLGSSDESSTSEDDDDSSLAEIPVRVVPPQNSSSDTPIAVPGQSIVSGGAEVEPFPAAERMNHIDGTGRSGSDVEYREPPRAVSPMKSFPDESLHRPPRWPVRTRRFPDFYGNVVTH